MLTAFCASYVRDDDDNNNNIHNNADAVDGCQGLRGDPVLHPLSSPSNIDEEEEEGS